jgi:hypothetical protein
MNWIIFGIVMGWLGIVSWFDIRKNEIPHPAWVVIPLMLACLYRFEQGGWALVLMAAAVSMASEREWLAIFLHMDEVRMLLSWTPLLFLGLYFAVQENPIAAMAILGFWLAWELKCWGGADAVAAITLLLIYPEINYLLSFFAVHLLVLIVLWTVSFFAGKGSGLHRTPGLPLLIPCVLFLNLFK